MRIRTKYILFIAIIHLTTLVLAFFIFEKEKILFIASEVIVVISLYFSWRLYRAIIEPLQALATGVEAIRDRDFTVKFLPTGKPEMDQLINVYNNMIDELRVERTKQEQQHFFLEKLIYTSPTGIIILDFDKIVEQVNPKALMLLGLEEKAVLAKPVTANAHPLLQQIAALNSGESKTISINGINTYKVQVSSFVDRGFPRLFILIEELTAEILATEKKVYEKIIRMMAHEVNNTIGPVNSIMHSTLKNTLFAEDQQEVMQTALQVAISRNDNLNKFMRNFADLVKLPEPRFQQVDVVNLVRKICQLMYIKAEEKQIELLFDDKTEPFYIRADEQQMEQALINIVKNSLEAIEQKGLVIFNLDTQSRALSIIDTGKGISEKDSALLFSSFFSTKKDGQGIGLMLVREIFMNHGFTFSLKTIEGQTHFTIRFNQ